MFAAPCQAPIDPWCNWQHNGFWFRRVLVRVQVGQQRTAGRLFFVEDRRIRRHNYVINRQPIQANGPPALRCSISPDFWSSVPPVLHPSGAPILRTSGLSSIRPSCPLVLWPSGAYSDHLYLSGISAYRYSSHILPFFIAAAFSTASRVKPHFSSTRCEAVLNANTAENILMISISRKPYSQMRFTARGAIPLCQ